MGNIDLQCLLIGQNTKLYSALSDLLNEADLNCRIEKIKPDQLALVKALKKNQRINLIFIADNVPLSMTMLADMVWQYSPDAIVVIVTEKTPSTTFKKPFHNIQFARLNMAYQSQDTSLFLRYLIQTAELKQEFRRCKRLLGVSEKRCQWLVDSSREAIAYISRSLHLYANNAYLALFQYDSVEELRAIPVQDLIEPTEFTLFEGFIKDESRKSHINRSLVITMRKRNGLQFRASIVAIPTVFKGKKCIQLWVHPLNTADTINKQEGINSEQDQSIQNLAGSHAVIKESGNPFEILNKKVAEPGKTIKKEKKAYSASSILKGIIRREEAKIIAQKLKHMRRDIQSHEYLKPHYLLSLHVPIAQRKGIDNLLFDSVTEQAQSKRAIFWDKVKLTRLLQLLIKRDQLDDYLLFRISDAAISDKTFVSWLFPGLRRLGAKTTHLVVLIPSQLSERQRKNSLSFIQLLQKYRCKTGLDEFSASNEALAMLRHIKPDYVRLSLPWVKMIEGNAKREIALASLVRQMENKGIRIIAPCGFSSEMKKLFALAGVSFCQEKTKVADQKLYN